MCWICSTNDFKVQNAEEDIVVYKVLKLKGDRLSSICFDCFPWVEGETYGSLLQIRLVKYSDDYYFTGLQGLHSYIKTPEYDGEALIFEKFISYTCWGPASYNLDGSICLAKCIVPKGTTYAINKAGEVISDKLQFIKLATIVDNKITFEDVLDK